MPFSSNWSEAVPQGSFTKASSIDEVAREFKSQVRERVEKFSDFPGDEEEGTCFLLEGTARIHVTPAADRPLPEGPEGELHFASDTRALSITIADEDGEINWDESPVVIQEIHGEFDARLAAGSQVTVNEAPFAVLSLHVIGVTDESGFIYVDLTPFGSQYTVPKILTLLGSTRAASLVLDLGYALPNVLQLGFQANGQGGLQENFGPVEADVRITFRK